MNFTIQAACISSRGLVRRNNEDNYYFNGVCLPAVHDDSTPLLTLEHALSAPLFTAVFDGMGGENFGELASFAAADRMRALLAAKPSFRDADGFLDELCQDLNRAVVAREEELLTSRMGTTAAMILFSGDAAHVCNVGDSRIYLSRGGMLHQLSVDHVEELPPAHRSRKAPLTQHLGIPEDDFLIEPHIQSLALQRDDFFLICSDGVTDMLRDDEIAEILRCSASPSAAVLGLLDGALENGGRDNITAIVCLAE